jgi:organic radical activating enzyme
MIMEKFFPILSNTSCKLKWSWSTLYLNSKLTASCHRASVSDLTAENLKNFHNTSKKVADRQTMLDGNWPVGGCEYCKNIEQAGGYSDRNLHNNIPDLFQVDEYGTQTTPAILEVYFNNTCNLSCVYCSPSLSSSINQEYIKYGEFDKNGIKLTPIKNSNIDDLEEKFWQWMQTNFNTLQRFHMLGGEPFYQSQLDKFIDFVDKNPNPDCEFNVITNLMISKKNLETKIAKIKKLIAQKKLKRLDITASIDCWGSEQEYVRYGLDLKTWKTNFEYLLNEKWIKLNINQTISVLTIKSMPQLLTNLKLWRLTRNVGHYFSITEPGPSYMKPKILGRGIFDKDFKQILQLMPNTTHDDNRARQYMQGIADEIENNSMDTIELNKLFTFLNENDRRRSTSWPTTFPWLKQYVV